FEVVELFLAGPGATCLELELGPHGHYLALLLSGPRRPLDRVIALAPRIERAGRQWRAEVELPSAIVPRPIVAWNAYAMHGAGARRRFLAVAPVPGDRPDFHRPDRFVPGDPTADEQGPDQNRTAP
ncbi:MAG TPA: hypothetical protein VD788_09850, partial [Candidatus Polarisedimenticolaceae bacterium]|nr:hypothetical protein [Candidatus Polarisedimenticolaceae bacterium]